MSCAAVLVMLKLCKLDTMDPLLTNQLTAGLVLDNIIYPLVHCVRGRWSTPACRVNVIVGSNPNKDLMTIRHFEVPMLCDDLRKPRKAKIEKGRRPFG